MAPPFSGEAAFADLKRQCDLGPRPLGSDAHDRLRAFLVAQMDKLADKTVLQEFTYRGLKVTNVAGVFFPKGQREAAMTPVLILAHWDTRPVADGPFSDTHPTSYRYGSHGWNRTNPIPGADDGASGVAVMLELARMFHARKPDTGVILLFDDGEDYGDFEADGGQGDGVELGSRYFAKHFGDVPAFGRPAWGILLDMVGGSNLLLPRETVSQQYAPGVNDRVYAIAAELGYGDTFLADKYQSINDDHVAINVAGIPTIDLIHPLPLGGEDDGQSYKWWHTVHDTPDKCSPRALRIVGETVAEAIYRTAP